MATVRDTVFIYLFNMSFIQQILDPVSLGYTDQTGSLILQFACTVLSKLPKLLYAYFHILTVTVQSLSSVQLFYSPIDCSPPGASVHAIFQARILEWVATPFFSKDSIHVNNCDCNLQMYIYNTQAWKWKLKEQSWMSLPKETMYKKERKDL